ncbi:MAG: four helix bundle protein [Anaerolineae bacterium]
MARIAHFRQLEAWKAAHQLVLHIYSCTRAYPRDEQYVLVSQMRRAAISVPANIAEGFKRRSIPEKLRFCNIAEGSLEELKYYLVLSADLGYIDSNQELMSQADQVGRLLNGLADSTRRRR